MQGAIPRAEATDTIKAIKAAAKVASPLAVLTPCGSYRRGKATSGDIDILVCHETDDPMTLTLIVAALIKRGILLDHMTSITPKVIYMGFEQYKTYPVRRIDLKFIPKASYYTGLIHYTGPFELTTVMRKEAKKRHMILNEYGLYTG